MSEKSLIKEVLKSQLDHQSGEWTGSNGSPKPFSGITKQITKLNRSVFYLFNPRAKKIEKIISRVAGLGLSNGQYAALAPCEFAHGPVFITGCMTPTIYYNVFDDKPSRGIKDFVQVKMHLSLPNRVEFQARRTVRVEKASEVQVYDDYKGPGLFLLEQLSRYFPCLPIHVLEETKSKQATQ